jgi:Raf kinase inhibitor-like YbhB/YbcL family protein
MLEKLPDALGHALLHRRAGLDKLAMHRVGLREGLAALDVTSSAFVDHAPLPRDCTADGAGVSPPLQWSGVPAQASSLVLVVEDADAPTPQPLVHAIAVGLAPDGGTLALGALSEPERDDAPQTGRNSVLTQRWLPPDPPPGHGTHRYAFQLFALSGDARFSATPGREEVLDVLREHALACGCLIGTYERDTTVKADGVGAAAGVPLRSA